MKDVSPPPAIAFYESATDMKLTADTDINCTPKIKGLQDCDVELSMVVTKEIDHKPYYCKVTHPGYIRDVDERKGFLCNYIFVLHDSNSLKRQK